ncbi:hypothetical protein IAU59_002378 [Kwoniella sp. CBS 9459]
MTSSPNDKDDRQLTRPLTRRELQACWVELPADPGAREEHIEDTAVDEVLPKRALNHGIDELSTPKIYPTLRTAYDLLPSKTLLIAQSMRTFKLSVIRDAVLTSSDVWRIPNDGGDVFKQLMSNRIVSACDGVPVPDFERVYDTALELKDRANAYYTSGQWLEALGTYGRAWITMLPYHIFAFPAGDRRAFLLGELDTTIFNNMTATCLDTYRKSHNQTHSQIKNLSEAFRFKLLSMGFNSGMAAAYSHHAGMMTVGSALKLSRRLLEISKHIQSPSYSAYGHPGLPQYMVEHHTFLLEHLKDKPTKVLLYDAAPELKARIDSLDR